MGPDTTNSAPMLQLTWRGDALHLWAIDVASGRPLPLANVIRATDRIAGRHVTAASTPSRFVLDLPAPTGRTQFGSLMLSVDALADLRISTAPVPAGLGAGASMQWFIAVADLARAVIGSGRVRPRLTAVGPVHTARWSIVDDPGLEPALAALRTSMPPVCGSNLDTVFPQVVDALARRRLADHAWRPPAPLRARGTDYRAAHAAFRALASASGSVLYRTEDLMALSELARVFDAELDRASGLPVLAPQLRLSLPDDADGSWVLSLELYDVDQPDRWCTAFDVLHQTALAFDLADNAAHLVRMGQMLTTAAHDLADHVGLLTPLALQPEDVVELAYDEVDPFLTTAPAALHELGIALVGPEQLVKVRSGVNGTASPRTAGAGVGSGRFTAGALVQWTATVDGTPVDERQLERAALAGSSLMHVNGRWVRLDAAQARTTLERLHRHRTTDTDLDVAKLLALAASSAADTERRSGTPTTLDGEGWVGDLLAGLPDERLTEMTEPPGFVGTLRHYQRRGLSWLGFLGRIGLGGCLADDMGLGKTATTLAHLITRPGPHLVVCPLSVVHNWFAEAARFTPQLQVSIHHGGERLRTLDALTGSGEGTLVATDVVVTTYGLLARDIDTLAQVPWDTLVLDEAQNVKNHLTKAAKAVRRITANQRLALTGTPVENHLGELWSILDAVNPGLYGSSASFSERYSKPIQRTADPEATAALRALTQPFVLRRTKADKTLLPELPDKIEQIAWATLTREQAAMYQAVVDQLLADAQAASGMRRRGLVLAALTRLKQICNHPAHAAGDGSRLAGRSGKLTRFDELVDDLLEVDERALVFTQFREMGMLLQRHLFERFGAHFGQEVPFLHGGVPRAARDRMVARFQEGGGPPLLLVSLKAGGTGLNLTSASQVIHYDRWWNPAVEDQATDRAWRLGQLRTVLVHKLVCEGTLEERIGQLIDDKKQLANSVLGTGEQWLTELSSDDLRALVSFDSSGGTGGFDGDSRRGRVGR